MSNILALLHPLLFSIIFVIMPYTQYAGLIPAVQIVVPFIVICAITFFLYLIIKCIVKNADVAVSLLTPLLIIFWNYGILSDYIYHLSSRIELQRLFLIISTLVILLILVYYIARALRMDEKTIKNLNQFWSVISCVLIVFNLFSIKMQSDAVADINRTHGKIIGILPETHTGNLLDIYFIILDEYAAPSQMKSYFQYDMSIFVENLRQKGFMVTEMNTGSLTTSAIMENLLNMEVKNSQDVAAVSSSLLDSLLENMNIIDTRDEEQMIHIRNSKVIAYLKSIGYQFIQIGSWFAQTKYNQLADQNINCAGFQFKEELPAIIVSNSVLRLVETRRYFHRRAVLNAFSTLENMPKISNKPQFIFAHIYCPHVPYIFGKNGEKNSARPRSIEDEKQLYLDNHIFISKKVKEFVDKKLTSSQSAPVIIIQADHGTRMDKPRAHRVFSAVYIPNL